MENTKILKERFNSEIALLQLRRKKTAADTALRQAKFDLRQAQQERTLYGGSFKGFLDKFTGKREEAETTLHHAVQRAEADLAAATRSVADLEKNISRLEQTLAALPQWDTLKTTQTEIIWYRFDALLCAQILLPLLEINHQLLLERRNQMNGSNAGDLKTAGELADLYTAPEKAGEDCKPYILRLDAALEALGMHLPDCAYFHNPSAFLNSATKYTRFDRLNEAIAQTESLLRSIPALQRQLEQEAASISV